MTGLDLKTKNKTKQNKTKKNTWRFWNFLRGKIAKFWKIRIFERNLALHYSSVRKYYISTLDLNIKKQFSTILESRQPGRRFNLCNFYL